MPPQPPESGDELGKIAVSLLEKTEAGKIPVRLAGVGLSQLVPVGEFDFEQLDLPLFTLKNYKK